MTTQHLLSRDELRSVLAVTPTGKGGFLTLNGKQVPFLPPTVNQVVRHVAKYESVKAFFAFGAAIGLASQAVQAGEASPVTPDADAYMSAQIQDGPLADAAMVAIAIGAEGDSEIEAWLLSCDPDEFEVALETVQEATWGNDPSGFWGRVGRAMGGRLMRLMQAAATKQATTPATSSPAT